MGAGFDPQGDCLYPVYNKVLCDADPTLGSGAAQTVPRELKTTLAISTGDYTK